MRQFRGLFIALALLAALGGGAYWSFKNDPAAPADDPTRQQSKDPAAPKVLSIPDAEIAQLELRRKGQAPTVLKRASNAAWDLTAPKAMRADADAVIPMLNLLSSLNSESLVDEKAQEWATYGLKEPAFEIVITKKDGKTATLQVGDELPAGGALYARVAGESKLYTIGGYNRASLDKTWKDLRDKRLLTVDPDKLSRIEAGAVAFGKSQSGEWQIVKPALHRADNLAVQELASKLKDAKLDAQITDDEAARNERTFAAAAPVGIAKLTDAAGTQQLEIRKAMDKDVAVFYAKSSAVEGAHKVGADLGAAVAKTLDQYRSRKLFDFGFSDPSKVTATIDGATRSYGKNGEKWFLDGKEMKPETVQNLIDKLRDLAALKFSANPANLKPAVRFTVISNDGKRTEMVSIDGNFAARGDEAYQYELAPASVDELKKAAASIAAAVVAAPDGKKK